MKMYIFPFIAIVMLGLTGCKDDVDTTAGGDTGTGTETLGSDGDSATATDTLSTTDSATDSETVSPIDTNTATDSATGSGGTDSQTGDSETAVSCTTANGRMIYSAGEWELEGVSMPFAASFDNATSTYTIQATDDLKGTDVIVTLSLVYPDKATFISESTFGNVLANSQTFKIVNQISSVVMREIVDVVTRNADGTIATLTETYSETDPTLKESQVMVTFTAWDTNKRPTTGTAVRTENGNVCGQIPVTVDYIEIGNSSVMSMNYLAPGVTAVSGNCNNFNADNIISDYFGPNGLKMGLSYDGEHDWDLMVKAVTDTDMVCN
ncbi:MAG: hypothetical protein JXR76_24395 [Deltaproteobacteria bacterium]|nr:hypothetical protein [Deltaproteobacteria bacterium]